MVGANLDHNLKLASLNVMKLCNPSHSNQGLYNKTFRALNLQEMERFCSKTVSFLSSVTYTGLDKHTSLLKSQYITNL